MIATILERQCFYIGKVSLKEASILPANRGASSHLVVSEAAEPQRPAPLQESVLLERHVARVGQKSNV